MHIPIILPMETTPSRRKCSTARDWSRVSRSWSSPPEGKQDPAPTRSSTSRWPNNNGHWKRKRREGTPTMRMTRDRPLNGAYTKRINMASGHGDALLPEGPCAQLHSIGAPRRRGPWRAATGRILRCPTEQDTALVTPYIEFPSKIYQLAYSKNCKD